MSHYQLDARQLLCPMPVIRTQNRVKDLETGDTLEVFCTDPGTLEDIPAWCRINGHAVVNTEVQEQEIVITVKVGD